MPSRDLPRLTLRGRGAGTPSLLKTGFGPDATNTEVNHRALDFMLSNVDDAPLRAGGGDIQGRQL
jgi:hypothetical protein